MGRRKTKRMNWSVATVTPTKTTPVKLVVTEGRLVAVKVTSGGVRLLRNATRQPVRYTDFGATRLADAGRFLLAEEDTHTPRESALQVGSWLGARVYLDVLTMLKERKVRPR